MIWPIFCPLGSYCALVWKISQGGVNPIKYNYKGLSLAVKSRVGSAIKGLVISCNVTRGQCNQGFGYILQRYAWAVPTLRIS